MKTVQQPKFKNNIPNAKTLLRGLRAGQYDFESALGDLIDNSLDAGASLVKIYLGWDDTNPSDLDFYIADNGKGMSVARLEEAMCIASPEVQRSAKDLGKFGMGLCTASLHFGDKLTVITKQKGGKAHSGINDYEEMAINNNYLYRCSSGTAVETYFQSILDKEASGTIVSISKVRSIKPSDIKGQSKDLEKALGTIFCKKIQKGVKIELKVQYGEWKTIKAIDPVNLPGSKVAKEFLEEEFEYLGNRFTTSFRILRLSDEQKDEVSTANSGFYIYRNERLIASAQDLKLFVKHGDYTRFRGEILFDAAADEFFGVNVAKRSVILEPSSLAVLRDKGIAKALVKEFKVDRPTTISEEVSEINDKWEQAFHKNRKHLIPPSLVVSKFREKNKKANDNSDLEVIEAEEKNKDNKPKLVMENNPKIPGHPSVQILESNVPNPSSCFTYELESTLSVVIYQNHPRYIAAKDNLEMQDSLKMDILAQVSALVSLSEGQFTKDKWTESYLSHYDNALRILSPNLKGKRNIR